MLGRVVCALLSLSFAGWCAASESLTIRVPRLDGSLISATVVPARQRKPAPLLLVIAGSGCFPSDLGGTELHMIDWQRRRRDFALLIVERAGPKLPPRGADGNFRVGPDFRCSEEFKRYYSVDERVADHLRVVQHLRAHAPWWNRRLVVWGFSEGGVIGGRLAPLVPETTRLAMAGAGGGLPFSTYFEDHFICPVATTPNRESCLSELRAQFDRMRQEPVASKSWNGDANTWKVWASRLDVVLTNTLIDFRAPLLLVHGAQDTSTPVISARVLARDLRAGGLAQLEYIEVERMGHSVGAGIAADERDALWLRIETWLADGF